MKNRTLALITAAIITAAALILTASLSLLTSSADSESSVVSVAEGGFEAAEPEANEVIGENHPVIEEGPLTDIPAYDPETAAPEADNAPLDEETVTPEDAIIDGETVPTETAPAYEYPVFDYVEGDARNVYVGGGEHVDKGVVIDVYSHKTGKLVGQLAFTSQEITSYISSLMREEFKPENELWIEQEVSCVALPEGDYRIEVYAGTWFSYTYGTSGIFELTQCTLTFSGGEKLTGYIDFLIADLIADIEAGNVEAPDPEMAVSKLIYAGIEGYWEGYYNEVCNMYIPGEGRWCERFPYIEE